MGAETQVTQPLTVSQVKPAALVLARAFVADPAFAYVLPQVQRREPALAWLFERLVAATLEVGQVFTTSTLAGVALWLGPERDTLPPATLLRKGMLLVPLALGWPAFWRFVALGRCTRRVHERTMRGPHLYLLALGVDPSCQRRGVGKALLAPGLAEADARRLPCYLDTTNAANLAYYGAHGFVLAAEETVAEADGLALWAMVRPARQTEG